MTRILLALALLVGARAFPAFPPAESEGAPVRHLEAPEARRRQASDGRAQPPPVFKSGVEVVELDVSVTRGGQPVQGLVARDFALTDNGVAQDVQSVTLDRLPLSITMILDTSESVDGDRLAHLVQAGEGLTAALRAD